MRLGTSPKANKVLRSVPLIVALALGSQLAFADPTTLVCDVKIDANLCCVADGPGSIVLDEAAKSVTIHYPPTHTKSTGAQVGNSTETYAANFGPDTIAFQVYGRAVTLSRLTGVMVDSGLTWTCHAGKAQF